MEVPMLMTKLLASLVAAGLLVSAPMALAEGKGDAHRSDTAAEHAQNHKAKKEKNEKKEKKEKKEKRNQARKTK
jgi:hypothetical protein